MGSIALPARAKLNLDLEVVCRRPDGMHELRTHMQAIELHDLLIASPADETSLAVGGIELTTSGSNTVLRAHQAIEKAVGKLLPTSYELHKRIPPGSGLGGASSDAAAAMRALVRLHHLELDASSIAPSIGADVSFFLHGGAALVGGVGEQVVPVASAGETWFALAWPGIELSTAAVYEAWDRLEASARAGANQLRAAAAVVDDTVDRFAEHLGADWQMTGSGSAFFLRCADRAAAEEAVAGLDGWTAVTHSVGPWE